MAVTTVTLYRSLMGDAAKLRIRQGEPDPGMLDPRWQNSTYKKNGKTMTSRADVRIEIGEDGPEVVNNGKGTSLHDVSGWYPVREFVIPAGTEYSDEILIVKDAELKTNPAETVSGYHYMLTARTRMAPVTFKGYLDNMARAAVVMQVKLASGTKA